MRRRLLASLLMATAAMFASAASAQTSLSPTPPETQPNAVMSMPVENLAPVAPLPPPGQPQPSLLLSTTPQAPAMVMMPATPQTPPTAPAAQPAVPAAPDPQAGQMMMMAPASPESQPNAGMMMMSGAPPPVHNPAAAPAQNAPSAINSAISAIFGDLAPSVPPVSKPTLTPSTPPTAPAATETAGTAETAPSKPMEMPEFVGIEQWLNTAPLTKEALKGKVVLVDFWTYSCVNCVRTFPYLKEWYQKYKDRGFVIVGVHSPEFDFEKDVNNVKAAVQKFGIAYPVALDNQMATWAAYQNNVWPAHYFIDATGKVRHIHLGEGDYDKSEQMIQKLLTEAMEASKKTETQPAESQAASRGTALTDVREGSQPTTLPAETKPTSPPAKAKTKPETRPAEKEPAPLPALSKIAPNVDFSQIKSPETYLGLLRRERLVTSGRPIEINEWMFDGKWRTEGARIVLAEGTGKILFRFNAAKVNLVMAPTAGGVQAVVKIDGLPVPQPQAGADVKNGTVMITEPRMYELINLGPQGSEHIIEIEFLNPGAAAYAFTFG